MRSALSNSQAILEAIVVAICSITVAIVIVGIMVTAFGNYPVGRTDFIEYWASGHELIHYSDPYSVERIGDLERANGFPPTAPTLIMWNPPYALPLTLPLGLLSARAAHILWLLLLSCSFLLSIRLLWIMNGRGKKWINLLGYSFAPALICLLAGQVSLFVLLGLVLFLYLNKQHPFWAGMALWFCLLKPQLFVPFGLVLLAWIITTRSYIILAGSLSAVTAGIAIVLHFDSLSVQHYLQMVHAARLDLFIPCLSIVLRRILDPTSVWIEYVPALLGSVWALNYFRTYRKSWNWSEHGSLVMAVSVLVAPYMWLIDQAVLIPVLLRGVYKTTSAFTLLALAIGNTIVVICAVGNESVLRASWLLWTVPYWLAWYLYAIRLRRTAIVKSVISSRCAENATNERF